MSVWVAVLTMVDSECYADGIDHLTVTVHETRAGAADAIRSRFTAYSLGRYPGGPDDDGEEWTAQYVPVVPAGDGVAAGEFIEDDRFEWTWSITPESVRP